MKEKLIIRNFGPIKNVELELGRFNVLIGENATGKSMVAKVLASIQNIFSNEREYDRAIRKAYNYKSDKTELFRKSLAVYEINNYLTADSFIQYYTRNENFIFTKNFAEFDDEKLLDKSLRLGEELIYIPADRIATSLFSTATWAGLIDIEEGRIDMPKYFLRYINLFDRVKRTKEEFDFTEILGVRFKQENGIDKVILENGTTISVNESASAIQSNLSLCIIIDCSTNKQEIKKTFVIEEPELNLFPAAQNKLMQYLVDKTMNYGNSILLTTHSPYSLTSINNLIYAYQVGQNHTTEIEQVLNKKYWLNPKDVSAYRLMVNGTSKNILDEEMKLIEVGEVDEISRNLNEIFEKISNVEYSTVDEN